MEGLSAIGYFNGGFAPIRVSPVTIILFNYS
jgi:hypothetical protein